MDNITLFTSFSAGIVSFFAPCTFVILPLFISYLSNLAIKNAKLENFSKEIIISTTLYIIGFSIIFSLLGMTANILGNILFQNKDFLRIASGIILILFGISMIFGDKIQFLSFSFNNKIKMPVKNKKTYFTPFLFGIFSAISFSPCISPILGSMLVLASSTTSSAYEGGFLLFIYAMGINFPLLLIAIFIQSTKPIIQKISKYTNIIHKIFGLFLIIYSFYLIR